MTTRDIYPFWPETHQDLIDCLLYIKPEQWDNKAAYADAGSIRQIVTDLIRFERLWTVQILMGRIDHIQTMYSKMSTDELLSELNSARASTEHFLNTKSIESLREVRVAPADPFTNQPETNVPIAWIIWHILENELISFGKIKLRLSS
jgi:uncharacterized damage-inducible protein DinB